MYISEGAVLTYHVYFMLLRLPGKSCRMALSGVTRSVIEKMVRAVMASTALWRWKPPATVRSTPWTTWRSSLSTVWSFRLLTELAQGPRAQRSMLQHWKMVRVIIKHPFSTSWLGHIILSSRVNCQKGLSARFGYVVQSLLFLTRHCSFCFLDIWSMSNYAVLCNTKIATFFWVFYHKWVLAAEIKNAS